MVLVDATNIAGIVGLSKLENKSCQANEKPIRYQFPTSDLDIMTDDPVIRHFFSGFIRLHILYHATKEPIYGAEITKELGRHGYQLSQGTLYPTLHTLEKLGYLQSESHVVEGRKRKYYQATKAGHQLLAEARTKLHELVAEIIEDEDKSQDDE